MMVKSWGQIHASERNPAGPGVNRRYWVALVSYYGEAGATEKLSVGFAEPIWRGLDMFSETRMRAV